MDRTGANYDNVVNMIRDNLSANPVIVNYPIGAEADFIGYVDLVQIRRIISVAIKVKMLKKVIFLRIFHQRSKSYAVS